MRAIGTSPAPIPPDNNIPKRHLPGATERRFYDSAKADRAAFVAVRITRSRATTVGLLEVDPRCRYVCVALRGTASFGDGVRWRRSVLALNESSLCQGGV